MIGKTSVALLLLFLTLLTGVCPQRPRDVHVKAGDMVALQCPYYKGYKHGDTRVMWNIHTLQQMDLNNNTSPIESKELGVLVHGRSLVILAAAVKHQGNYSCSRGNSSRCFWFSLTVYTQSREYKEKNVYSITCYTHELCTLSCPDVNTPPPNTLNITSNGITWHKEGESSPKKGYMSSAEENEAGSYTCTRSYLYHNQLYNMTFHLLLDIQPNKQYRQSVILSPQEGDVIPVYLGSVVVVHCNAVLHSDFDEVFWLIGNSFVETDDSQLVYYNYTRESDEMEIRMTASLVLKNVSAKDLSKNYTCKLETTSDPSSSVTITLATIPLAQEASSSYFLALSIGIILAVAVVAVIIYVKVKTDIFLFLRDSFACYHSVSDAKGYDAFLMCYKSDTDAGLNEHDRKWIASALKEKLGYSLCLDDCDISSERAEAEAVLDCIEQSRTVILVPSSSEPCLGSDQLSVIHKALVERQSDLVFIKMEATDSGLIPEVLQPLSEAGDCVTWEGTSSMSLSSSFWNQLHHCLPAPQHVPKIRLLP